MGGGRHLRRQLHERRHLPGPDRHQLPDRLGPDLEPLRQHVRHVPDGRPLHQEDLARGLPLRCQLHAGPLWPALSLQGHPRFLLRDDPADLHCRHGRHVYRHLHHPEPCHVPELHAVRHHRRCGGAALLHHRRRQGGGLDGRRLHDHHVLLHGGGGLRGTGPRRRLHQPRHRLRPGRYTGGQDLAAGGRTGLLHHQLHDRRHVRRLLPDLVPGQYHPAPPGDPRPAGQG